MGGGGLVTWAVKRRHFIDLQSRIGPLVFETSRPGHVNTMRIYVLHIIQRVFALALEGRLRPPSNFKLRLEA